MEEPGANQRQVVDLTKTRPERVRLALEEVEKAGMSEQAAAKKWHVDRGTLRALKADPNHSFHRPTVTLTATEELKLIFWMDQSTRRGYPRTRSDMREGAFRLLKLRKGDAAKTPSKSWLDGFAKRHGLSFRKAQRLGEASARVTKSDVLNWFTMIHQLMINEGFENVFQDPSRIYNADESFFHLTPDRGRVLVKKGMKNVFDVAKDEKAGLTVMLLIRADGKSCRPMIVFPGQRLSANIRSSASPNEVDMAVSESGWMTGEVFCQFLQSVEQQAVSDGVDMPNEKVFLFVDNYSSHLKLECFELALKLGIVLIPLCANTTFLTQPADVSCFHSLKTHFKDELSAYKFDNPEKTVTKEEFPSLFLRAFKKLSPEVVQNGFKRCGLFPWDPEAPDYSKLLAKGRTTESQPLQQDDTSQNIEYVSEDSAIDSTFSSIDDNLVTKENLLKGLEGNLSAETEKQLFVALIHEKLAAIIALEPRDEIINPEIVLQITDNEPIEHLINIPTYYSYFGSPETTNRSVSPLDISVEQVPEQAEEVELLTSAVLVVPVTPKRQGTRKYKKKLPTGSTENIVGQMRQDGSSKEQAEVEKKQRKILAIGKRKRKLEIEQQKLQDAEEKVFGLSSTQPNAQHLTMQQFELFQQFQQHQSTLLSNPSRPPLTRLENLPDDVETAQPTKKPRGRPRKLPAAGDGPRPAKNAKKI